MHFQMLNERLLLSSISLEQRCGDEELGKLMEIDVINMFSSEQKSVQNK